MTDVDRQTVYRLVRISKTNLDIIRGSVRDKDIAFAKAICDRLETDLRILKNIVEQEE